jgi:hypothetical protein
MPIEKLPGGGIIVTGEEINVARMLALKGALHLECLGMRHSSGRSVLSTVKKEFGLKGNSKKVYDAYCTILREKGVLS